MPERLRAMGLTERQIKIVTAIREVKSVKLGDVKRLFPELSDKTVQRELRELVRKGILRSIGEKKGRRYELAR